MRIRGSLEQAICIVLLISTSSRPVKSSELSKKLDVSDSYLKKIMRQLVKANIVSSIASKTGGFVLLRSPSQITFLDLFNAIEERRICRQYKSCGYGFILVSRLRKRNDRLCIIYTAELEYRKSRREITIQQILTDV
ncbi:MAG: RrF2 family transcriptional regulator [[Clostridium] innocuum]